MANTLEGNVRLVQTAEQYDRLLMICHLCAGNHVDAVVKKNRRHGRRTADHHYKAASGAQPQKKFRGVIDKRRPGNADNLRLR